MKKTSGNTTEMYFNLKNPAMKFDFNDMRSLLLLVGKNGIGKSFVLVSNWLMSILLQMKILNQPGVTLTVFENTIQYYIDHSFDLKDIDGVMGLKTSNGCEVSIELENGKVKDYKFSVPSDINQPSPVVYMSSAMRLFTSMSHYLKIRKTINNPDPVQVSFIMTNEMGFKIFDVNYIETLISKAPIKLTQQHAKFFQDFEIREHIEEIYVDLDEGEFSALVDGNIRKLSTFGNGHQAIINMCIGSLLFA